jgi:hypothetical protein
VQPLRALTPKLINKLLMYWQVKIKGKQMDIHPSTAQLLSQNLFSNSNMSANVDVDFLHLFFISIFVFYVSQA